MCSYSLQMLLLHFSSPHHHSMSSITKRHYILSSCPKRHSIFTVSSQHSTRTHTRKIHYSTTHILSLEIHTPPVVSDPSRHHTTPIIALHPSDTPTPVYPSLQIPQESISCLTFHTKLSARLNFLHLFLPNKEGQD